MNAVALADVLVAAPATGAATVRTGRDSGSRFGEVLDAAGLALADSEGAAARPDSTSGGDEPGITDAEQQTAPLTVPAVLLTTAIPALPGTTPAAETAEVAAPAAEIAGPRSPDTAEEIPADRAPTPTEGATAVVAIAPVATTSIGASSPAAPSHDSSADGALPDVGRIPGDARRASASPAPETVLAGGGDDASASADPDGTAEPRRTLSPTGAPLDARPTAASAPSSAPLAAPASPTSASAAASAAPSAAAANPADDRASGPALSSPTVAAASPTVPQVAPTPIDTPAPATQTARAVAAQVSPVVVSIAQRPTGTHQLTMTVNPDTLGPVTVRAHIGQAGDVRVELIGATDAGRDALRSMVADLRRDLAAAMPHATLSVSQSAGTDAGADRGGQTLPGGTGDQSAADRGAARDVPGVSATEPRAVEPTRTATTTASAPGSGLDILA